MIAAAVALTACPRVHHRPPVHGTCRRNLDRAAAQVCRCYGPAHCSALNIHDGELADGTNACMPRCVNLRLSGINLQER